MRISIIIALLTGIIILGSGCSQPKLVKPRVEDVKTIKARLWGPDEPVELFTAKPEDYASLLAILDAPELDSNPANWVVLGALIVELSSGEKMVIHLYGTAEGKGAYSWEVSKKSRIYYRGSSNDEMVSVIERAYANVNIDKTRD